MHLPDLPTACAPYGLAFAVDDLMLVRNWAEQRGLKLSITLDCQMDGAEFEELLILAPPGAQRRTLTIWRTQDGVYAQTPASSPHCCHSLRDLLAQIRPVRARTPWLQRLGLVS